MILPDKIFIANLVKTNRSHAIRIFEDLTIRLLALKYAYYVLNLEIVKDVAYDGSEREWYALGIELNILSHDEISPCIDFDFTHPKANAAIELANKLI